MDKTFIDVINNYLSFSLKNVNVLNVKKSFTIENYYDIENTIILPISGKFRFGRYKKIINHDELLFVPAHNVMSLSFGSNRSSKLAYDDFIDNKGRYLIEDNGFRNNLNVDKYFIMNIDVKAFDLINIFHSKYLKSFVISKNSKILSLIKDIMRERYHNHPGSKKIIELISSQILYEIIRIILSKQPMFSSIEENFKFFNDNKTLDLFHFIDSNLEKELSNRVLSNHLNISEDYVGQFFRNNIGFSAQDYIEHRRMERAIELLREKSNTIKTISNDVGYKDTAYFCRRFKLMFGVQAGKMKKRINEF
jgi:AraC family transcriptional regulator of arabinose operon